MLLLYQEKRNKVKLKTMNLKETFFNEIAKLNDNQRQLLKDTVLYGEWGDTSMDFLDENGERETVMGFGFITNDAKEGGHFSGRQISGMFSHIVKKLCPDGIGRIFAHIPDWWQDGSGDVLFVRGSFYDMLRAWAEEKRNRTFYSYEHDGQIRVFDSVTELREWVMTTDDEISWDDTVSYFSLYSSTHYDLQMSLREFFDCNIKHLLVE